MSQIVKIQQNKTRNTMQVNPGPMDRHHVPIERNSRTHIESH